MLSFVSVWKAAALAIAQLGVAAFFIASVAQSVLGPASVWWVLGAVVVSVFVRAIDVESWALLIPGGTVGRMQQAFGARGGRLAIAATLVERLGLSALAALVAGHYVAGALIPATRLHLAGRAAEDLATAAGIGLLAVVWIRARIGLRWSQDRIAQGVWIGVSVLLVLVVWAGFTSWHVGVSAAPLLVAVTVPTWTPWHAVNVALFWIVGAAVVLPVLGGGDALSRTANEFAPPRLRALRRTSAVVLLFVAIVIGLGTVLYGVLIPGEEGGMWLATPLTGLARHVTGPLWLRDLLGLAIAGAALLVLIPAVQASLSDAEALLQRLALEGRLTSGVSELHRRFGTPVRVIDMTVIAVIAAMLVAAGRVPWLARAYGMAVAITLLLKLVALLRLRRTQPTAPYRAPLNVRFGAVELPWAAIVLTAILLLVPMIAIAVGDLPATVTLALVGLLAFVLQPNVAREAESNDPDDELVERFHILQTTGAELDHLQVRPGCILVPVRNPHALDHVVAALRTAGDRDVVVMTARLVDIDTGGGVDRNTPTPYERRLLAETVAVAERIGHAVRLLIVPAHNVVDAIVATVLRVRASDVYVGESASLSVDDQVRMLGDAWERVEKPEPLDLRLVIAHRSGRTDTYHLGAHPPSLSPADLDLIHRVWLDAVTAVGPQVHHHDVVRAALTQMEEQLTGPNREEALAAIRRAAQPAQELAVILRARDYARLRDLLRNRHAGEVAELLTALPLEDQVVVFRVLPRKAAAAVFEYLAQDAKETLLKAMAQDDVASLLNNMAPDERTMFLEELPAAATRQLLTLLTPQERSVALALLGYPERSVGRLMTPHYVAVREQWTVQEVLDYVRAHGQDSETLNVIYVVDDQGLLIDDIRIREFLLAPLGQRVSDLMDRRFVTLTATDDQEAAVAVFRQYDRSALPVTDTAGMLIGIVTIDDVLDVAEATATREIQRIGGSEALDEPYMRIAFGRMIQKRAGWLMALFIGEMLTATAMGFFQAEIQRAVTLALFVPLIISSGGNSGSQASTLVIRALALGEVTLRDWWRVMRREVLAGLTLGAILGTIGFVRIALWSAFSDIYGEHWLLIAVTVAISLVGVVLWGTLSGSLLPFVLSRLGFDPAASSAPFVATLVDVTGLVIYFSVALVMLHDTLLKTPTQSGLFGPIGHFIGTAAINIL